MTYVGAVPTTGDFKLLDSITTSSSTTFNLRQGGVAVYPQSANHCLVQLNGINQVPGSSFNIVNDTIVFASSLSSDDVINQILVLGNVNDIGVPSDDTVSTAKLQSSSVTTAKINADAINSSLIADDSISDEHLDITAITGQTAITSLADTDKFLVSDASDSGNLKYVEKQYLGGSEYIKIANVNGTNSVGDVSINDCFSTTYRTYLVTFQFENDRNGNQVWLRWQADDDSTFNSNYRYACHQTNDSGGTSTRVATGDSKWLMCGGTAGGNTAIFGGCFGYMYVHNPYTIASGQAGAGNKYRLGWNAHYNEYSDSGEVVNSTASGMLEQNDYNVAGLRFLPSANYVAKRNVTVWGLKEY